MPVDLNSYDMVLQLTLKRNSIFFKGFFRRMVNERDPGTYICGKGGNCEVNSMTRNMCKACRYAKCLQIGMCIEGEFF